MTLYYHQRTTSQIQTALGIKVQRDQKIRVFPGEGVGVQEISAPGFVESTLSTFGNECQQTSPSA
jgi:hypothetical protein